MTSSPCFVVVAVCKFRIFLFLRLRPTYFFRSMWPTLTQHVSIAWQQSSSECSSACLNVCCSFEDVLLDPTPILILYIFWKTNFSSPTAGGGLLPGSPTIVSDLSNGIKVASEYIPGNWSAISGTLSFCCLFFNLVKLIVYCCCLHLHQSIFHHSSVLQSVYKQSQHCLPRVSSYSRMLCMVSTRWKEVLLWLQPTLLAARLGVYTLCHFTALLSIFHVS